MELSTGGNLDPEYLFADLAFSTENDVREGVRMTRLAARICDIGKYPEKRDVEKQAAIARRDSNFEQYFRLSMFP